MKRLMLVPVFLFFGVVMLSACSEDSDNTPAETVFGLLSTTPVAANDTIFADTTVQVITVEIQSNVKCNSAHPEWMKKAESPEIKDNKLVVKYVLDKLKVNGVRDGKIVLSTADGTHTFSLNVRQVRAVKDDRVLLFSDDFEGTALDTDKWGYESKDVSAWNYYVVQDQERVQVKNGNLLVRATWDAATQTPKTGAISTHNKFSFKYGEIEVRAKFTRTGQGSWPAIWMMPQTFLVSGWPDCGELDIMERLNNDSYYYTTIHMNNSYRPSPYTTMPAMDASVYNVYGMKKSPEKIEFYLNGVKTFTMNKPQGVTESVKWPFDTDFYLILNQACADMGASGISFWPGLVNNPEELPFEMAVDWVKVYELK